MSDPREPVSPNKKSNGVINRKKTGKRIKAVCKSSGFSNVAVANELGISPQAVHNCFVGVSLFSVQHLYRISQMTGTTIDDLLVADYKGIS